MKVYLGRWLQNHKTTYRWSSRMCQWIFCLSWIIECWTETNYLQNIEEWRLQLQLQLNQQLQEMCRKISRIFASKNSCAFTISSTRKCQHQKPGFKNFMIDNSTKSKWIWSFNLKQVQVNFGTDSCHAKVYFNDFDFTQNSILLLIASQMMKKYQ